MGAKSKVHVSDERCAISVPGILSKANLTRTRLIRCYGIVSTTKPSQDFPGPSLFLSGLIPRFPFPLWKVHSSVTPNSV